MEATTIKYTLGKLAEITGGEITGRPEIEILGVCSLDNPRSEHITFVDKPQNIGSWPEGKIPGALIVRKKSGLSGIPELVHDNPRLCFAEIMRLFHPTHQPTPGISKGAVVSETARVHSSSYIGPNAVIFDMAGIGEDVVIGAGCFVGERVEIGSGTKLHPNVTILNDVRIGSKCIIHSGVVIGSDGFGFIPGKNGSLKVPQVGTVEIGNDVEIGANTTIDRATLDVTIIEDGVKLDNLVQIAHNVRVGRGTMMAAQCGLPGRVVIEEGVVIGGQAGFANGVRVGAGTVIGGRSGITKDIPPGSKVSGYPLTEHSKQLKIQAVTKKLPEMLIRLTELEETVKSITESGGEGNNDGNS